MNILDTKTLYFHYDTVTSTNDIAFEKLNEVNDFYSPIVVTADEQTFGRGRNNKRWLGANKQNLYYSIGIKHSIKDIPIHFFQIIGGLATYKVLSELTSEDIFRLKYPNDVYGMDGVPQKIAGVISETNFFALTNCCSLIGIGINISQTKFPSEIAANATSLSLLGIEISLDVLVKKLTNTIIDLFNMNKDDIFLEWITLLNLDNKKILVNTNTRLNNYHFSNFLEDGRLLLKSDDNASCIIDNGDSVRYDLM